MGPEVILRQTFICRFPETGNLYAVGASKFRSLRLFLSDCANSRPEPNGSVLAKKFDVIALHNGPRERRDVIGAVDQVPAGATAWKFGWEASPNIDDKPGTLHRRAAGPCRWHLEGFRGLIVEPPRLV
jgi:hypothetical protein